MVDETHSFLARPSYIFVGYEGEGMIPSGAKFWFCFYPGGEAIARQHAFEFMKNRGPIPGHRFEWVCSNENALLPQAGKVVDLDDTKHFEVGGNQQAYGARFYTCFYNGDVDEAKQRAKKFMRSLNFRHGDCVEVIC